jgi:hypothetical protein
MFQQFTAGPSLADKVAKQLVEMTDRLCREFAPAGGAADEVVRGQVREVRAGFGSPKVLSHISRCWLSGPSGIASAHNRFHNGNRLFPANRSSCSS